MSNDFKKLLHYILEMRKEANHKLRNYNESSVHFYELRFLSDNLSNIICKANEIQLNEGE